jgi:hypothetical protein
VVFLLECPDWSVEDFDVVVFEELPPEMELCPKCVALHAGGQCSHQYRTATPLIIRRTRRKCKADDLICGRNFFCADYGRDGARKRTADAGGLGNDVQPLIKCRLHSKLCK